MRNIIVSVLSLVLFTSNIALVSAKPQGDWSAVKNLSANEGIAIKTKDGVTSFGLLVSSDDSGISILLADKERVVSQETVFQRGEIKKVWRAKLRFDENNMAKGAWIGAGAGLGAAFLTAWALRKQRDADACVGCGLFPLYGASIGAVIGVFSKKGHKKGNLIYGI
jgi:hypothetical protein